MGKSTESAWRWRDLVFLYYSLHLTQRCAQNPTWQGHLRGSPVERLPLAQGVIPGFGIESPIGLPMRKPATPSSYVSGSLCMSLMNK